VKHLQLLLAGVAIMMTAIVMTAAPASSAQTAGAPGRTTYHGVTQAFGFGPAGTIISAKPHAPFSALLVDQIEEALSDGTNITRNNEEVVMRDGMGRIYRSRKIELLGASERNASSRMMVTITDPVLHVQYVCTPIKVCRKMGYRPSPNMHGPMQGPGPAPVPGRVSEKDRNVTVEDLGTSTISGVEVVGERVTRMIPEGMVGNDRPFASVEERWHSERLDVDVQVKRSDPRAGSHTTTITEVNFGEPDPSYFQIPEGYRVEEGSMPPQPQVEPMPPQNQ